MPEQFVTLHDGQIISLLTANDARKATFSECKRTLEIIPLTKGALMQHVKLAIFKQNFFCISPSVNKKHSQFLKAYGWIHNDSNWILNWTSYLQAHHVTN